jgi:hypothetical protein
METYTDNKPDGVKCVGYDDKMRVREITLFRDNKVIDTWFYTYNRGGRRAHKDIAKPGLRSHVRLFYDTEGNRIREELLTSEGRSIQLPAATPAKAKARLTRSRRAS